MPSSADDQLFGGPGSSQKVYAALVKQYGAEKARQVYEVLKERQRTKMGGKSEGLRSKLAQREKGRKGKAKAQRGGQRGNPFA